MIWSHKTRDPWPYCSGCSETTWNWAEACGRKNRAYKGCGKTFNHVNYLLERRKAACSTQVKKIKLPISMGLWLCQWRVCCSLSFLLAKERTSRGRLLLFGFELKLTSPLISSCNFSSIQSYSSGTISYSKKAD